MDQNHHHGDRQSHQNIHGGVRQKQNNKRHDGENDQHRLVGDRAPEDYQRLVSEEVEQQPDRQHDDQDDERDRVPEEAEEDDYQKNDGVVHAEVAGVSFDAGDGVSEGFGEV